MKVKLKRWNPKYLLRILALGSCVCHLGHYGINVLLKHKQGIVDI